jgi:hypothetical protein
MSAAEDHVREGSLVSVDASVNQALAQITKAEIDQQVATAHAWPRSIAKFQKRALEMVTFDEETAESCIYSRPVGKNPDGTQKYAEGLSVRTAEIVGACYGNLRVGAILVEMTERYVKARGFAHDLETNFASTSEVVESTVDKYGRPFSERMRVVVAKAALAKARRDATFAVVPKALCKGIENAARQTAIGDATTLAKRRGAVMSWVGKLGIDSTRVFAALGVQGEADLGLDHLTQLTGIKTAIKDGDTTVDEAFPPLATDKQPGSRADQAKDALRGTAPPADAQKPADPQPKQDAKPADTGGATTEKPAADAKESEEPPQYDEASAIAELRKAGTEAALDRTWKAVVKDFNARKKDVPLAVEAARNERREAIRSKI